MIEPIINEKADYISELLMAKFEQEGGNTDML